MSRGFVIALLLVLSGVVCGALAAAPTPSDVVAPPEATVVRDGERFWLSLPRSAPTVSEPGPDGSLVLPEMGTSRLLLVDDDTGTPLPNGFVRWLGADIPDQLKVSAWHAPAGQLDLLAPTGVEVEITVPGYHPAAVRLAPGPSRATVALRGTRDVRLGVQPAAAGEVLVASTEDLHLLSKFAGVATRWEIPATGEVVLSGLPARQSLRGVVYCPGWAPIVGALPADQVEVGLGLTRGVVLEGQVVDCDGQPVAHVEVVGSSRVPVLDGWSYAQRAVSGPEGRFTLTGFLPGTVELVARASGYARSAQTLEVGESDLQPLRLELGPGRDVKVVVECQGGKPLPGVTVRLQDEAHVTGRDGAVTLSGLSEGAQVEVQLEGATVVPSRHWVTVASAPVRLVATTGGTLRWPLALEGPAPVQEALVRWRRMEPGGREVGDGRGAWLVEDQLAVAEGLTDGRYVLEVRIDGHATARSEPVDVGAGEVVSLAPFTPATGRVVLGRVVDGSSLEPVPAATVKVHPGSPVSFHDPRDVVEARSQKTDADGMFRLLGLEPREYRIRVESVSHATGILDGVVPLEHGATDLGTVELGQGLAVEGLVLDRQRRPVAGASVEAREPGPYAYFAERETVTDEEGRFALRRLSAGRWQVEARAGSARVVEGVDGTHNDRLELELVLGGVTLEGQVVQGGRPVPPGFLSLSSGDPGTSGVVVLVDRGPGRRGTFGLGGPRFEAQVGEDGRFRIEGVDPGSYTLAYRSFDSQRGGTSRVEVPDLARHSVLVLLPDGAVHGTVVDPDGRPVAGASVRFLPADGGQPCSSFSGGDGGFRLAGLPETRGELVASQDGFQPSEPVDLEPRPAVDLGPVTLRLGPRHGVQLSVRVLSAFGPAPGAPVTLQGRQDRLGFTDLGGVASFEGVHPGAYDVCGRVLGGPAGCRNHRLEITTEGQVEVELALGAGGWVEVVAPLNLEGARVQVLTAGGADLTWALLLGNPLRPEAQRLVLGPLVPGGYQIAVSAAGVNLGGTATVEANTTVVLTLR